MKQSALRTEGKKSNTPILIVDKIGVIGEALSQEFSKDYLVFFISSRELSKKNERIVQVPFKGKIPKAPDNFYFKTFLIDDGLNVTRESSLSFLKRAKENKSSFYFLGSIRNMDLEHADGIINSYREARVLIFGDLFDNEILFDKDASISKFINGARRNKKIKVPGDGLSLNYPVSFADTVKLIIKATYLETPERAILLFARHPITDISLANTFQKIDPDIGVDFVETTEVSRIYFPKESQYALSKYDIKKKLSEIDLEVNRTDEEVVSRKSLNYKFAKPAIIFLFACLLLLLLPLVSTYTYSILGQKQMEKVVKLSERGEFEKALVKSENSERLYNFASQTGGALNYQAELLGKEEEAEKILRQIDSGVNLSDASTSLLKGVILYKKISSGEEAGTKENIQEATGLFKSAYLTLEALKASEQIPKDLEEKAEGVLQTAGIISAVSEALPNVLGFDKEKTYLILFTDNLELRPGGGVVVGGSIIKIKNGKITSFEILGQNVVGSNQKTEIEAPYSLRRHLPAENFQMRDSFYNADFVKGAIETAGIFKVISGKDIDGVIGINSDFLKRLISAIGSLETENKTITSKDFYELAFESKDRNAFYLNLVENFLVNTEKNSDRSHLILTREISKAITEKEILFAFKDEDMQSVFTPNNLSGSLIDQRVTKESSINDYFGISEANLGKNPANYFISRSITRDLRVDDNGSLISTVNISLKNNSENSSNTSQTYKNYMQLILPIGARIQNGSMGGRGNSIIPAITDPSIYERSGFTAPNEFEVEQVDTQDKSIFGFLVSIPSGSVRTISFDYNLPFKISDLSEKIIYSLLVYKQPGVSLYSFEQKINLPQSYSVFPQESINSKISKDQEFIYSISRN